MRQVGVLAAAALVGIEEAWSRLTLDHKHAKQIAQGNVRYETPFSMSMLYLFVYAISWT